MQLSKKNLVQGIAIAIIGLALAFWVEGFAQRGYEMEQQEMGMPLAPQEGPVAPDFEQFSADPSF